VVDAPALRRTLHVVTVLTVGAGVIVGTRTWEPPTRSRNVAEVSTGLPPYAQWREPPDVPAPTGPSATMVPAAVPTASAATRAEAVTAPALPAATTSTTPTGPSPAPPVATLATPDERLPEVGARLLATSVVVRAQPGSGTAVALRGATEFGNPRVLPVTALGGDWLQVMLPSRPNGSIGWIRARDAELQPLSDQIQIDLQARTVTWLHGGVVVLSTTAGIGAPATPTPTGTFFVTDVLPDDPGGPHGAFVVALDAHSDAYTTFEGGDARIAIHGTDAPSSIGADVSNGCLRIAPDALRTLASGIPLGTPVVIR